MGRKSIEVKTLHGSTIEDLYALLRKTKNVYSHDVLQAVIMRYQGISTTTILESLGKSRVTIIDYIKAWNEKGLDSIKDNRGNNVPTKLTPEIVEDVKNIILNKCPKDFGYDHNNWSLMVIAKYIQDTYGLKYSKAWLSKLVRTIGFTYKRGVFQTSLANKELQQKFKKNDTTNGYY